MESTPLEWKDRFPADSFYEIMLSFCPVGDKNTRNLEYTVYFLYTSCKYR